MDTEQKNIPKVSLALSKNHLSNDKIMLYLIAIHWFIATALTSIEYGTYLFGFITGGIYFSIALFTYVFYKGKKEFRIMIGILFMFFSMLFIQQHLGRIEMHFHIFIAISFLTLYKDTYAVKSATITTAIYHILFNYLQENQITVFGKPVYIFNYGCGYDIVFFHIIFAIFEALVIIYFIKITRQNFINMVKAQNNYQDIVKNLEIKIEKRTKELSHLNFIFEESQQITKTGNWEWNIAEDTLIWSNEIYRIFGLKPKAFAATYEAFIDTVHKDDRQLLEDAVNHTLATGEDYSLEHRIVLPDGSEKIVFEKGKVELDQDKKPIRMIGTVHDITKEYKEEKELKLQSNLLNSIAESVFVHNVDGSIIYVNEAAAISRGYSKEELLKMRVQDLDYHDKKIGEDIYSENMKIIEREMKEKGSAEFETQHITKDRKVISLEVKSKIITDHDHQYIISIVSDLTERKALLNSIQKSEEQYRSLVDNSQVGIFRTNLSGAILYANTHLIKITGYDSAEELYKQSSIVIYKDPFERSSLLKQLITYGKVDGYEANILTKNNEERVVKISAHMSGDIISGIVIDITASKQAMEEVVKFSKAIEQTDDIVIIADKAGVITFVNDAFVEHTGYSREESVGKTSSFLKSGRHNKDFYKNMWKTIKSGATFRGLLINRKKNGEVYYEEKTITPIRDNNGDITAYVSTGKDLTERIEKEINLDVLASTDQLTGIYNRHKFDEILNKEIERAQRYNNNLSLIMFDIDHFKKINDTFGHDIGDIVLKEMVTIVKNNIRNTDVFARWGGEEFLILCPETEISQALILAEKVRSKIDSSRFDEVGKISASFGVAAYRNENNKGTFIKRVDDALYKAKDGGRNRVEESC